jgi:hypothetical protein
VKQEKSSEEAYNFCSTPVKEKSRELYVRIIQKITLT